MRVVHVLLPGFSEKWKQCNLLAQWRLPALRMGGRSSGAFIRLLIGVFAVAGRAFSQGEAESLTIHFAGGTSTWLRQFVLLWVLFRDPVHFVIITVVAGGLHHFMSVLNLIRANRELGTSWRSFRSAG